MSIIVVFAAACVACWIVAGVLFRARWLQATSGHEVIATVTDYTDYISHGQTMYSPIYTAYVDGHAVTGTSSMAKSWKSPPIGTQVKARYNPGNPDAPLTTTSALDYIGPLVLVAVGGFMALFAVAPFIASWKSAGAAPRNAAALPSGSAAASVPHGQVANDTTMVAARNIQNVFRSKAISAKTCYTDSPRRAGQKWHEGDVRLAMTISAQGQAVDIKVEESTLNSPAVEACLVKEVRAWPFPVSAQPTPFAWTFHFTPND